MKGNITNLEIWYYLILMDQLTLVSNLLKIQGLYEEKHQKPVIMTLSSFCFSQEPVSLTTIEKQNVC